MYAFKRNDQFIKHKVFEVANTNYKRSNVCVLTVDSMKSVTELLNIWPDAEFVLVAEN